jgi:hypothetical protein
MTMIFTVQHSHGLLYHVQKFQKDYKYIFNTTKVTCINVPAPNFVGDGKYSTYTSNDASLYGDGLNTYCK